MTHLNNNVINLDENQKNVIAHLTNHFNLHKVAVYESPYWGQSASISSFDDNNTTPIRFQMIDLAFLSSLEKIRWIETQDNKIMVGL